MDSLTLIRDRGDAPQTPKRPLRGRRDRKGEAGYSHDTYVVYKRDAMKKWTTLLGIAIACITILSTLCGFGISAGRISEQV